VARVVVALIGVGCAVTVYVMLRPRPQVTPTAQPILLDDTATAVTKQTTNKRVDESGQVTFSLNAGTTRVMADDRKFFEGGVTLKFRKADVNYVVTANQAEGSGRAGPEGEEPSKMIFKGRVKMVGDNGFSVESEDATYLGDEQRVMFPGAVAFTRERMEGQGVGADLYMDKSVLWMYDQSQVTIKPEGAGSPVTVTGKSVGFAQAEGYLRAKDTARMTREDQVLTSDELLAYFSEGTQSVSRIELQGRAAVTSTRRTGPGKRPDMRGDSIILDFMPQRSLLAHARMEGTAVLTLRENTGTTRVSGSLVEFYLGADGDTLVKLDATAPTEVLLPRDGETPERTIRSSGLVAEGPDPKGLERAVFNGGVQYRETLPAARGQAVTVRLAKSDSLVLGLGGALNQVTVAQFRQSFCFVGPVTPATVLDSQCATAKNLPSRGTVDDTVAAAADEGTYDAKAETLRLRVSGPARPKPWVVNQDIIVTALEVDLDLKQSGIDARPRVDTFRKPTVAQAKESRPTGLFENGKPVSGQSDRLKYSRETGVAVYSGEVLLFQAGSPGQEGSKLQGDEVRIDDRTQDIAASGHVRSTFFIAQATDDPGKTGATKTTLNSDQMTYKESSRTAVYTGSARMESGPAVEKQNLEAYEITLVMQERERALKNLVATAAPKGLVLARLPEGKQATGLRLTYDAETDLYVVTGTPAQFVSRSTTKGPDVCEIGIGESMEFLRTAGLSNVRTKGGAVGRAGDRKCVEVIK